MSLEMSLVSTITPQKQCVLYSLRHLHSTGWEVSEWPMVTGYLIRQKIILLPSRYQPAVVTGQFQSVLYYFTQLLILYSQIFKEKVSAKRKYYLY